MDKSTCIMVKIFHLTFCHAKACFYRLLYQFLRPLDIFYQTLSFYISPFVVIDSRSGMFWGDKSCWISLAGLELFSASGFCSVKFFHILTNMCLKKCMKQKKNFNSFPNFQRWLAIFKLLSFLNTLSYWDRIGLK